MLADLLHSDLTPGYLVGLAVLFLMTGIIVPRPTYKEKAREAARWHEAYEKERDARVLSESQSAELLELAKTSHSLITAMFNNSEIIRRSGGTDVLPKEQ